jgi:CheY-like chemotaxis protein
MGPPALPNCAKDFVRHRSRASFSRRVMNVRTQCRLSRLASGCTRRGYGQARDLGEAPMARDVSASTDDAIGGREVAMIFADVRLRGVMDGIDLAREVKMRWPLLPIILTSGHPREHVGELPPGVTYMPKPWQPLISAEQALASRV